MLVLSRKLNESIVINENISIVVVDIRGDKVRLGVEVPREGSVHRGEVWEAIKRASADTPSAAKRFTAKTDGLYGLGLREICERFANEQPIDADLTPEHAAASVLASFKLAVEKELESLNVEAGRRDTAP